MVQYWQPGVSYTYGDVVEYEGAHYRIIQAHTSQSDWTPPITPALWGRVPKAAYENEGQGQHQEAPRHEEKPSFQQPPVQPKTSADLPPEEREKHWYDLDDKQKKALEIGGGVAAGLGLLGAGFGMYRHHEKKEEEKKALAWSLQKWIEEAQRRTEEFHRNGPRTPTTWVLVHGKQIPPGAIVAGRQNGQPVYIARTFHEGGIQVGHASQALPRGGRIGYAHNVVDVDIYEVLLGDSTAITWVDAQGRFGPENFSCDFVEGGREGNGVPIYIALVNQNGVDVPGKASKNLDGALIAYDGTEKRSKEYKVLAYVRGRN